MGDSFEPGALRFIALVAYVLGALTRSLKGLEVLAEIKKDTRGEERQSDVPLACKTRLQNM